MKCVIPGANVKVFGRAIHSLSKIGEELYIEPLEYGLALRTVNSSRSAYACFLFAPSFFLNYDDGSGEINSQDSEEESLRCKIAMKSCLTVFKSLSTIEKTVERCKIHLNMSEARLVFKLHCKHGIVKTHNLSFIECETLQAVFSKDMCPNSLTAQAKLLCDAVVNFQTNQEEVTLIVNPEKVVLKNYVDDEPDPKKVMHTELSLALEEFDYCQVGVDTEVTFCLKELRAILAFAEVTSLPVSINFESAGRPIVFTIDSDKSFEGNFVLATLAESGSQGSCSQQPSQASVSQHPGSKISNSSHSLISKQKDRNNLSSDDRTSATAERQAGGDRNHSNSQQMIQRHEKRKENSDRMEAAYAELMNDDMDDMLITEEVTVPSFHTPVGARKEGGAEGDISKTRENERTPSLEPSSGERSASPVIPYQSLRLQMDVPQDVSACDISMPAEIEQEEEDLVPGTPPSKKFRSMFFGSQASTCTQMSQKANLTQSVLAEDTDED